VIWIRENEQRGLVIGAPGLGVVERNADLVACILQDADYHSLTKEVTELRFGPPMAACREVLGAKLSTKQRAALGWRWVFLHGGCGCTQAA
jgi:hypothetical protein